MIVYSDGTAGTPKYRTWDGTSFDTEQSATSVGAVAIEWIKVVASPVNDEWIIATRDADDDIDVQVCTGQTGGISCGSVTNITTDGGAHGFRNFDLAYEQKSGDAVLVYGTSVADGLRKIEWRANSWQNDTAMTPATTAGAIEWVELTPRTGTNQIGISYADDGDDVSGHIWTGQGYTETTSVITTTATAVNARKMDVSFESTSGDMLIATQLTGVATWNCRTYSAGTWASPTCAAVDQISAYVDLADNGTNTNYISMVGGATNILEGTSWDGTALDDDTSGTDTTTLTFADSYTMATTSYLNSTYLGVMVYSDTTGVDDINWYTMSTAGAWVAQTDNTRTRGTIRSMQLYDYPNANQVLLVSSDSNSDLWVDTLSSTGGIWSDKTSGGTLEDSLATAVTQNWDFAFRLDSASAAYTQNVSDGAKAGDSQNRVSAKVKSVSDGAKAGESLTTLLTATRSLTDGGKAGDSITTSHSIAYNQNLGDGGKAGDSITTSQASETVQNLSDGAIAGDDIEASEMAAYTENLSDGGKAGDSISTSLTATRSLSDGAKAGDSIATIEASETVQSLSDGAKAGDSLDANIVTAFTQNLYDGGIAGDSIDVFVDCVITCSITLNDGGVVSDFRVNDQITTYQILNAIKLKLNTPTEDRLGGVFVFTCPAGEWAYGITSNGELLCADPTP